MGCRKDDIQAVLTACHGVPLKVILETCLLTKEEIVKACEICKVLGVAFVKTSTGFNKGGANRRRCGINEENGRQHWRESLWRYS